MSRPSICSLSEGGAPHALGGKGGPSALLERLRIRRLARHEQGSAGAYPVAQVESVLGRREQALAHLEESCARHEPAAMAMRIDPTMANLRGEPEYQHLLARLGLTSGPAGGPLRHDAR